MNGFNVAVNLEKDTFLVLFIFNKKKKIVSF